jgi:hypothetical protein
MAKLKKKGVALFAINKVDKKDNQASSIAIESFPDNSDKIIEALDSYRLRDTVNLDNPLSVPVGTKVTIRHDCDDISLSHSIDEIYSITSIDVNSYSQVYQLLDTDGNSWWYYASALQLLDILKPETVPVGTKVTIKSEVYDRQPASGTYVINKVTPDCSFDMHYRISAVAYDSDVEYWYNKDRLSLDI